MTSIKTRLYKLLRWSEQYTRTDMVFAFSTGFWSVVAQAMSAFAALALALIVARIVSKTEYGEYQYIISVLSTITIFSLSGFGNAVLQSVARGYDQSLPDAMKLTLRWGIPMALVGAGIGGYYLYHGNIPLGSVIVVGGLLAPLIASLNLFGWFLGGKGDARRNALYPNGIGNVLPIAGIIVAAVFFHTGTALALGYIIANLLTLIFLFYRTLRLYPLNNRHDDGLTRYGFHLSAVNILSTIGGNLANLSLFHFLGGADVAIYNFAISIPDQMKAPISSFSAMMTSRFSKQTSQSIRASMNNKSFWIFIVTICGVGVYVFVAPFIYRFLFPAYIVSTGYSQLYVLSLLTIVFTPASSFLIAHKHLKAQYFITGVTSIFQIIAIIVGILEAGMLGVIIAQIATRLINALLSQILYLYFSRTETQAS